MKHTVNHRVKAFATIAVFLLTFAFAMTSCIFDSDENGLETWLSAQGMPSSFDVQTLSINNIKVVSAKAFLDTTPKTADIRATFGKSANLSHDLVLDIAYSPDSSFMSALKESDSSGAFLALFWLRPLYMAKQFPADSLPYDENIDVSVSWKIETGNGKKFLDSLLDTKDSVWYKEISNLSYKNSIDTVFNIKMAKGDTSIRFELPNALVTDLKKAKGATHLQLKLSPINATHAYRFYGDASNYPPIFALYSDSNTFISPTPFRMAHITRNNEDCTNCAVLHGGVYDSLVVELPANTILNALSEFYGDEFPYEKGNKLDVRQTVILAELTMLRDDSKSQNEFGLPIQVVAGSYVDSANKLVRRMENYRLNDNVILDKGHQNLVFHNGDSLTLQLTYGARDFINRASDGRNMKFIMRLGYPFLQEKDTAYVNYKTESGDSSYVFFSYFDYARYDFSNTIENPMTLKLWLASKRGGEK